MADPGIMAESGLPTFWKNAPDTSTPLEASVLNAWGSLLEENRAATVAAAGRAEAAADDASAPTDSAVADLLEDPDSATRLAGSALWRAQRSPAIDRMRAALASSVSQPCMIAFAGSSTTAWWNASRPATRFVNRVAAILQAAYPSGACAETQPVALAAATALALPGVHAVNAGLAGGTSATYLTPTTIAQVAACAPVAVVHTIGSNDFQHQMPATEYQANIEAAIDQLDEACPVPPVHLLVHAYQRRDVSGAITWSQYRDALAAIANERPDRVALIDADPLFAATGLPGADPLRLIHTDNVHATDAGLAALADAVTTALDVRPSVPDRWVVRDTFSRPASSTLGAAETGQVWDVAGGAFSMTGGAAATTAASASTALINSGLADLDLTMITKVPAGGSSFVVFRALDANTRLSVAVQPADGMVRLYKVTAGSGAVLAESPQIIATDVWHQVRAVATGREILAYLNGRLVLSHTLATADQTTFGSQTRVGVRATMPGVQWDNVGVRFPES